MPITKPPQNELSKALPAPGAGRWWKVTLNRRSRSNPIVITLMEYVVQNRKSLSEPLNSEPTIASVKKIVEAADLILARVGDYEKVLGEYT